MRYTLCPIRIFSHEVTISYYVNVYYEKWKKLVKPLIYSTIWNLSIINHLDQDTVRWIEASDQVTFGLLQLTRLFSYMITTHFYSWMQVFIKILQKKRKHVTFHFLFSSCLIWIRLSVLNLSIIRMKDAKDPSNPPQCWDRKSVV